MRKAPIRIPGRSKSHARTTLLCVIAALCMTYANQGSAQAALPTGFGSLTLGMQWDAIHANNELVDLTRTTSTWERLVYDCGYRHAQSNTANARLLMTAEDFTLTQLSYVTGIEKGSNLMRVAQLVINSYGQPRQATMRDALGAVTIDQSAANYITLEFDGPNHATFVVSGAPLWEYRISIQSADLRRAQNRTIRCARTQEKQLQRKAAKKTS
jgi:hypothetical protein